MLHDDAITDGIRLVESGMAVVTSLPMHSLYDYKELFENLGFDYGYVPGTYSTNGWDTDFWQYMTKDGEDYCLSGGLWAGNFKFGKGGRES